MTTDAGTRVRLRPEGVRRLLFAAFALSLLATAWVADDAYISFRTLDHFLGGRGLVWNVGERVQAFTHPLWFFLHSALVAVSGEVYLTTLALGTTCSLAAVYLLGFRLAATPAIGAGVLAAALASAGFVDYSTSGLENPLSHLLLVLLVGWGWREDGRPGRLLLCAGLTAMVVLNRLDLVHLALPGLALPWRRAARRERLWAAVALILPLLAWEVFSLVYFGFLLPNTGPAKLATGVSLSGRLLQGLWYFVSGIRSDGLTLAIGGWLALHLWRSGLRRERLGVASVGLYLAYVGSIGGDSMGTRFFTAPLVLLLALAATRRELGRSRLRPVWVLVAVGLLALRVGAAVDERAIDALGIGDERQFWSPYTGLWQRFGEESWPAKRRDTGWEAPHRSPVGSPAASPRVVETIGLVGYFAPPDEVIVDLYTLADPVRSRLPGLRSGDYNLPGRLAWRVGHIARPLPDGYRESLRSGELRVEDADLAAYVRAVWVVTRGPLWTRERWAEIWRLNTGGYRDEIRRWAARHPEWYPLEARQRLHAVD